MGVFSTDATWKLAGRKRWWNPVTWVDWRRDDVPLAAFPLSLAVTARRALSDPSVGPGLSHLLQTGELAWHSLL